jgi:hypothetical protein
MELLYVTPIWLSASKRSCCHGCPARILIRTKEANVGSGRNSIFRGNCSIGRDNWPGWQINSDFQK